MYITADAHIRLSFMTFTIYPRLDKVPFTVRSPLQTISSCRSGNIAKSHPRGRRLSSCWRSGLRQHWTLLYCLHSHPRFLSVGAFEVVSVSQPLGRSDLKHEYDFSRTTHLYDLDFAL
jgi:hypothetical protein